MDKPTAAVGAAQKIEKQARQLAYDTRYKVKQSMKATSGSRLDPAAVTKAYLAQLAKSSAAPAVKARAKQMLMGNTKTVKEEVMNSVDAKDMATDAVANALYKVFVEGVQKEEEPIVLTYMEKLETAEHRKYKVRVTDKKTGNTYVRMATREKIAELRANPNISSVEMTEYGEVSNSEASKGSQTAKAKSGKGLDPVGKEDGDIDNDGDKDKSDKYLLNRRQARGAAIAKRRGVAEEFLGEVNTEKENPDANGEEIDVMKGSNTVKINPEVPGSGRNMSMRLQVAHYDMQGKPLSESEMKLGRMLQEKAESEQQQKLFGLALSVKRGQTPRSEASAEVLKIVDTMSEKKIRDFAKTKHEGLPKKKVTEETVAQADKKAKKEMKEKDPRSIPTEINLAKTAARFMGARNPIVMTPCEEVEVIGESERREEEQRTYGVGGNPNNPRPERSASAPTGPKKKPAAPDAAINSVLANLRAQHGDSAVSGGMRTRKSRQR